MKYTMDANLVTVFNEGFFSYLDIENTLRSIEKDTKFKSGMFLLFVDEGSQYNPPSDEPKKAAKMLSSFVPPFSSNMAIIASKIVHYRIAQNMRVYCDFYGVSFNVFKGDEEARLWLSKTIESTNH